MANQEPLGFKIADWVNLAFPAIQFIYGFSRCIDDQTLSSSIHVSYKDAI